MGRICGIHCDGICDNDKPSTGKDMSLTVVDHEDGPVLGCKPCVAILKLVRTLCEGTMLNKTTGQLVHCTGNVSNSYFNILRCKPCGKEYHAAKHGTVHVPNNACAVKVVGVCGGKYTGPLYKTEDGEILRSCAACAEFLELTLVKCDVVIDVVDGEPQLCGKASAKQHFHNGDLSVPCLDHNNQQLALEGKELVKHPRAMCAGGCGCAPNYSDRTNWWCMTCAKAAGVVVFAPQHQCSEDGCDTYVNGSEFCSTHGNGGILLYEEVGKFAFEFAKRHNLIRGEVVFSQDQTTVGTHRLDYFRVIKLGNATANINFESDETGGHSREKDIENDVQRQKYIIANPIAKQRGESIKNVDVTVRYWDKTPPVQFIVKQFEQHVKRGGPPPTQKPRTTAHFQHRVNNALSHGGHGSWVRGRAAPSGIVEQSPVHQWLGGEVFKNTDTGRMINSLSVKMAQVVNGIVETVVESKEQAAVKTGSKRPASALFPLVLIDHPKHIADAYSKELKSVADIEMIHW